MPLHFLDSAQEGVFDELRRSECPNVIFGAGALGEDVLAAAKAYGIPIAAFCDNNPDGNVPPEKCGLPVMSPEAAKAAYPSAKYFIAVVNRMPALCPQLEEMGLDGRCLTPGIVMKAADEGTLRLAVRRRYDADKAAYMQKSLLEGGGLRLGETSLFVTEFCTLRCRDCTHRIPYFKDPARPSIDGLMSALDGFLRCVDGVFSLALTGGDALTRTDIVELAAEAARRDKVGEVGIYTNAIIPFEPERWEPLAGGNVYFRVTEYDHPRQKIDDFFRAAEKMGFRTKLDTRRQWTRFSIMNEPRRDAEREKKILRDCVLGTCYGINGDRFYRCPLVGVAIRQGLLSDDPDGYVDLKPAMRGERIADTSSAIRKLVFEKGAMRACAYCTSRIPGLSPVVPPGIQLCS